MDRALVAMCCACIEVAATAAIDEDLLRSGNSGGARGRLEGAKGPKRRPRSSRRLTKGAN
jgi:hypothetical protein